MTNAPTLGSTQESEVSGDWIAHCSEKSQVAPAFGRSLGAQMLVDEGRRTTVRWDFASKKHRRWSTWNPRMGIGRVA